MSSRTGHLRDDLLDLPRSTDPRMENTLFNLTYELGSYDPTMYQYDLNAPTVSGSHFSSLPQLHCAESSLDFSYAAIYPLTTCVDATIYPQLEGGTMAINPQVLHTQAYLEPHVEDALCDCAPSTPELVSTPQPPPTPPAQVASPEAYETFNLPTLAPAEVYPMKKDRQKGSANLLRSVCPALSHFQCSILPVCLIRSHRIVLTNYARNRRKTPIDSTNVPCVFGNSKDALTWLDTSSGIKAFDHTNA
jgi:hypothetical protein